MIFMRSNVTLFNVVLENESIILVFTSYVTFEAPNFEQNIFILKIWCHLFMVKL